MYASVKILMIYNDKMSPLENHKGEKSKIPNTNTLDEKNKEAREKKEIREGKLMPELLV